jgi:hypothetical protein
MLSNAVRTYISIYASVYLKFHFHFSLFQWSSRRTTCKSANRLELKLKKVRKSGARARLQAKVQDE